MSMHQYKGHRLEDDVIYCGWKNKRMVVGCSATLEYCPFCGKEVEDYERFES